MDEYIAPKCDCGYEEPDVSVFPDSSAHKKTCAKRGGGRYLIRTIPTAPDAKIERRKNWQDQSVSQVGVINISCHKCHEDLTLEFTYGKLTIHDIERINEDRRQLIRVIARLTAGDPRQRRLTLAGIAMVENSREPWLRRLLEEIEREQIL
jgi:hypothetical protein